MQTPRPHLKSITTAFVMLLLLGAALTGWLGYQRVVSDVMYLTQALSDTNKRLFETREMLVLVAEGNQALRGRLAEDQEFREQTATAVEEIAAEREALFSQIETLESELSSQLQELTPVDLNNLIDSWSARVGRVTCKFTLSDDRTARSVGSAVATYGSGKLSFVTNRHVIDAQQGYVPNECTVRLPQTDQDFSFAGTAVSVSAEKDLGWLPVPKPTTIPGVAEKMSVCTEAPRIGDQVIILGYPSVGSMDSVTATEGIISGFDEGMYVTSAKIEQGNSGGAAIHIKNDCFLGIPTLVVVGKIESLARILPL